MARCHLSPSQKIGPYEVLSSLGAGGMGEVYRARDTRLGREVALKILPPEFSGNHERLERFEQEARSASALNHPNIIAIYDIGSSDSTSYLAMELVEGKSLRTILEEGPINLRRIISLASQLADGLAKAHAAGIVHRDLKPENVMISKDGFLKILDFGLAKLTLVPTNQAMRQTDMEEMDSGRWFTRGSSIDRQPVYSHDGKSILFSSFGSGSLDLMQITIETGAVTRITEDEADDWDPYYTPDGNHILWSSNRAGHFEIWMANPDGSEPRRITNDGLDAENPTMSPDGRWIVYNSYNPEKLGVWKIHPDGTGATKLVSGITEFPEVSPDGKFVAYILYKQSVQDPISYIQVVEIETGKRIPFEVKTGSRTAPSSSPRRCRWMPDGKALAYIDSNNTGQFGVYVQDFIPGQDTFAKRRAVAGFDPDKFTDSFGISPDGASITLAEMEILSGLMRVKNVPGL